MLTSGIRCLDEQLGGLVPRRAHVLTGSPGTGKTVACLEFLHHGLEEGEVCAMLTTDDPSDLLTQGEYLGLPIAEPLEEGRLVLLRYQLDFARRSARLASPEPIFDELRTLIGATPPRRLVVDSIMPFLDGGPASGVTLAGLVECVESLGSTSLLTFPDRLESAYDRRLEPLARRAAAILHFTRDRDRTIAMEVQKIRYPVKSTGEMRCRIEPGRGIVSVATTGATESVRTPPTGPAKLLVLDLGHGLPSEVLELVRLHFQVTYRADVVTALSGLTAGAAGAVLIGLRRDSLLDVLTLVRELRRAGSDVPIILVTTSVLRSSDGARALRAGADDILRSTLLPEELVLRLQAAARHRHSAAVPVESEAVAPKEVTFDSSAPLDGDSFRAVVRAHLERDPLPFFTLLTVRPRDPDDVERLAALIVEHTRGEGRDLTGIFADSVAVYLHSARRKDVAPFVERMRSAWREREGGDLEIETATWPADEARIDALIAAGV